MRIPRTISAAAVAIVLAGWPAPAGARTKRLLPLDFVSANSSWNYSRSPVAIGALADPSSFNAPLQLPAGATITGLRFASTGNVNTRSVQIIRTQVGGSPEAIATALSAGNVPGPFTPAWTAGSLVVGPADAAVSSSHIYFVNVQCQPGNAVWAVDVEYAP